MKFYFLHNVRNEDVILLGLYKTCIAYGKKVTNLAKNDANIPASAGTDITPKMMGQNTEGP